MLIIQDVVLLCKMPGINANFLPSYTLILNFTEGSNHELRMYV